MASTMYQRDPRAVSRAPHEPSMITDNCARAFSWEVPEQVVPKLGMLTVSRLSNNIRGNQDVIASWH